MRGAGAQPSLLNEKMVDKSNKELPCQAVPLVGSSMHSADAGLAEQQQGRLPLCTGMGLTLAVAPLRESDSTRATDSTYTIVTYCTPSSMSCAPAEAGVSAVR